MFLTSFLFYGIIQSIFFELSLVLIINILFAIVIEATSFLDWSLFFKSAQ